MPNLVRYLSAQVPEPRELGRFPLFMESESGLFIAQLVGGPRVKW
jgi:hypothetical protein